MRHASCGFLLLKNRSKAFESDKLRCLDLSASIGAYVIVSCFVIFRLYRSERTWSSSWPLLRWMLWNSHSTFMKHLFLLSLVVHIQWRFCTLKNLRLTIWMPVWSLLCRFTSLSLQVTFCKQLFTEKLVNGCENELPVISYLMCRWCLGVPDGSGGDRHCLWDPVRTNEIPWSWCPRADHPPSLLCPAQWNANKDLWPSTTWK